MKFTALILGFIFGLLLKRGRFCFAGTIEDVMLEKHSYNLILLLALVSTEAVLYHIMVIMGVVPPTSFKYFSLLATIIGGLVFGVGAVLCSGCVTATLIKMGDGRITGIISVLFFMLGTSIARVGIAKNITQFLFSQTLIKDELHKIPSSFALLIFGVILLLTYLLMFLHYKRKRRRSGFTLPRRYSSTVCYLFCEKIWMREVVVILAGILMAFGFYFSNLTGRNDGFAITAPAFSIFNFLVNGKGSLDWGVMLVFGIILGSFFTAFISGELALIASSAISIIKHMIGGICMGLGATWAGGCIMSNGLVGTAQLSLRAWIALFFMVAGIWIASGVLVRKYQYS